MNMYVGNLNFEVSESDLRTLLEKFGTVESVKIITDRDSGRSKGYGFAEMANNNEAANAMQSLNATQLRGRAMVVKEAAARY